MSSGLVFAPRGISCLFVGRAFLFMGLFAGVATILDVTGGGLVRY